MQQLSPERQKKITAFKHEASKRRSLGAGLLLDYALRHHGLREKEMIYTYGPHGKPHIDGLHFNLSHSGNMVACAIGPCPIGIDIEYTSRHIGEVLIQRVCCDTEREQVRNNPLVFFDIWTAKEAIAKMTGNGLCGDLTAIDTSKATTIRLPEEYTLSFATHSPIPFTLQYLKITQP